MKYKASYQKIRPRESRPARALWIEIFMMFFIAGVLPVEAREGLVD